MIGERLKRARQAAGLSMEGLAGQVGVSRNMIKKYEHDISMPGSSVLIKLARALGVRSEYFFRPVRVELTGVEYRKRANTPARLLARVEADVLDQAERWQELANLWPGNFPVPHFAGGTNLPEIITNLEELEAVAEVVRRHWRLGLNAVPDLVDELESRGILVIMTQVDDLDKFDGLQATVAGQPLIVVSTRWPGDRQRFTLAHELGHLLLHGRLAPHLDEEAACNRFASAFLLPAPAIRQQLGERRHGIEPRELYFLKHEYGLSMASCRMRATDLGIIDQRVSKALAILFSRRGWRKKEPGEPFPAEKTTLFQQLVYRALGEDIISESKAAELLQQPLIDFHRARGMETSGAIADQ